MSTTAGRANGAAAVVEDERRRAQRVEGLPVACSEAPAAAIEARVAAFGGMRSGSGRSSAKRASAASTSSISKNSMRVMRPPATMNTQTSWLLEGPPFGEGAEDPAGADHPVAFQGEHEATARPGCRAQASTAPRAPRRTRRRPRRTPVPPDGGRPRRDRPPATARTRAPSWSFHPWANSKIGPTTAAAASAASQRPKPLGWPRASRRGRTRRWRGSARSRRPRSARDTRTRYDRRQVRWSPGHAPAPRDPPRCRRADAPGGRRPGPPLSLGDPTVDVDREQHVSAPVLELRVRPHTGPQGSPIARFERRFRSIPRRGRRVRLRQRGERIAGRARAEGVEARPRRVELVEVVHVQRRNLPTPSSS